MLRDALLFSSCILLPERAGDVNLCTLIRNPPISMRGRHEGGNHHLYWVSSTRFECFGLLLLFLVRLSVSSLDHRGWDSSAGSPCVPCPGPLEADLGSRGPSCLFRVAWVHEAPRKWRLWLGWTLLWGCCCWRCCGVMAGLGRAGDVGTTLGILWTSLGCTPGGLHCACLGARRALPGGWFLLGRVSLPASFGPEIFLTASPWWNSGHHD